MNKLVPLMSQRLAVRAGCLAASLLVALLAGCASGVKLDNPVPVETRVPVTDDGMAGKDASGANAQSNVATVDLSKSIPPASYAKVIYFDFDSFVVRDEFRGLIESHAKALAATRGKRLVIEGHTDERGGREYNLALGQKRAEAVQKSLTLLGVADSRLESVSYGEERPAVQGSDEAAWAKNRRAELRDR